MIVQNQEAGEQFMIYVHRDSFRTQQTQLICNYHVRKLTENSQLQKAEQPQAI